MVVEKIGLKSAGRPLKLGWPPTRRVSGDYTKVHIAPNGAQPVPQLPSRTVLRGDNCIYSTYGSVGTIGLDV
jgi:hypothetical protein